jgi:hypothetical protein
MPVVGQLLKFGFQWGAAKVTRLFSDDRKGWVVVGIETPKQSIQVYVTKTGKIRINDSDGEWIRPQKEVADATVQEKTCHR